MVPSVAQARRTVRGIRDDPVRFVREVLGHDPWSRAEQIIRAVAVPSAQVAVKACHASSKTHTAADLALWAVASGGQCVTTAPTWQQVETVLWSQIRSAYAGARFPMGGALSQTEWKIADDVWAIGLSTNEATRFQGFHAKPGRFLLIIEDESPGVRPAIHEAVEGIRAGGDVRWLKIGNPTVASGPFYDCFTANRANWTTLTIDALATPNLAGLTLPDLLALDDDELDRNDRPYLVTRRWVTERYREWGEDNPLWQARVRGQFPEQAEDSLISLAWIERAGERPAVDYGKGVVAGVDVGAGGGGETVCVVRSGPDVLAMGHWAGKDARGDAIAFLVPWRERLEAVAVDEPGVGTYFTAHLRDELGSIVMPINVGQPAVQKDTYLNLRAEAYFDLRGRMETGEVRGLTDSTLQGQLAGIRWLRDSRGRYLIESKDQARRRGVPSPDRADALMLSFLAETHPVQRGSWDVVKPARLPSFQVGGRWR